MNHQKRFHKYLLLPLPAFTLGGLLHGDIVIHGNPLDYQETGGDWQSMASNDIDSSGGLGTDGYLFFGNFNGLNTSGPNGGIQDYVQGTPAGSVRLPHYITAHAAGVDSAGGAGAIADEFAGYGSIDNPNFTDGTDTLGGFILGGGAGGIGENRELVTFTVSGLLEDQTVRVGVLAGIEANADGRWDSTSITLSDGTFSATVGDHLNNPLPADPGGVNAGWVFFDINANGDYAVSATKRDGVGNGNQGPGISGLTFDSISSADPDSDDDNLLDWWEMARAGNLTDLNGLKTGPGPGPDSGDFDGDGLTDLEEFDLAVTNAVYPNLDPTLADTDEDGRSDFDEINGLAGPPAIPSTDPTDPDTDDDGLIDGVESNSGAYVDAGDTGSDPTNDDSDADGVRDGDDENPVDASNDSDGDGISNGDEVAGNDAGGTPHGFGPTDPNSADSDGDGLNDGQEVSGEDSNGDSHGFGATNPKEIDSDTDGFNDSDELIYGGNPTVIEAALPNAVSGYTATGGDWLSAFGAYDIDGDGALGTDGFLFFGDFTGVQVNNQPYLHRVESNPLPQYLVSHDQGGGFTSAASAFASYAMIDNPTLLDGSDQFAGVAVATDGEAGSVHEMMTFEIGGLPAGKIVRVGVLGGTEGTTDGRWDATQITLAGPNGYRKAGINLEANPGGVNAGWLFFDLSAEGSYSLSATRRANNGGAGIGGVTFDSLGGGGDFLALGVQNNPNGLDLDFTWKSRNGMTYNLLSSPTLNADPATWTPVSDGITPTIPNATLTIPRPAGDKLFYVIQEVSAQ